MKQVGITVISLLLCFTILAAFAAEEKPVVRPQMVDSIVKNQK